jgi:thiol-disulfide isomerase/thioredoxin
VHALFATKNIKQSKNKQMQAISTHKVSNQSTNNLILGVYKYAIAVLLMLVSVLQSFAQQKDSTQKIEPDIWLRAEEQTSWQKALEEPDNKAFAKDFSEKFGKFFNQETQYKNITEINVDEWEMTLFDARAAQSKFYKEYPKLNSLSPAFRTYIEAQIRYNYWHLLLAHAVLRSNANPKQTQLISLPSILLEGFEKVKVDDETALNSEAYRMFLTYYVTYFNSAEHKFQKYTDMGKVVDDKHKFAREHLSGRVYAYTMAKLLDDFGLRTTPSAARNAFGALSVAAHSDKYVAILKPKLAEHLAKQEVAKKDENKEEKDVFKIKTLDNEMVSLKHFKGKVVYVDFWASWCGPCRSQFPFSKQLHEKLSEKQQKQVVFLYINIDEDEQAWRKALGELKLEKGFHVYSAGGWNSDAVKFFKFNAIPRYMLINKAGEIVQPNAKRPSDEFILNEILKLIEG